MEGNASGRPFGPGQFMVVLSFTLALFFVVAFVTKSAEAYRLRRWAEELHTDIAEMERQIAELQAEVERRRSSAWVDEALRAAGWVPKEGMSVRLVPATALATVIPSPTPSGGISTQISPGTLFDNANWEAWRRLILGWHP